jgi:hypothetical protein
MGKDSKDQENRADSIDKSDQVGNDAISPDENEYTGEIKDKAAGELAKKGRASPARGPRQEWLREIAKTAASARWQRGD